MAEQRLKELALRVAGLRATPEGPTVTTAVGTEGGQAETDVLRELAIKLGLSDADIHPCYASAEVYAWCLALLGARQFPPPSPLPTSLYHLLIKLVALGRIDTSRARVLGIDKHLADTLAERLVRAIRRAVEVVGREAELAEEVARVRHLVREASRTLPPTFTEDVIRRVREAVPPVREEHVLKVLGKEEPAVVAEEIVKAVKGKVAGPVPEDTAKRFKQVAEPKEEGAVVTGRAQEPRGGQSGGA